MPDVLPGVTVNVIADAAPSGVSTETGRLFAAGITRRGPTGPQRVAGPGSFARIYGERAHYDTLTDALRAFWRSGGGEVYVSRVVGPDAQASSVTIDDGSGGDGSSEDVLEITAREVGEHGDDLSVEISSSGPSFSLTVLKDGEEVESWSGLTSAADAAGVTSEHVRIRDLGSDETPDSGSYDLEGGDDDRSGIGSDDWQDALDRFDSTYGPGQVVAPGRESSSAREQLLDHAEEHGRIAFLDGEQGASVSDLTSDVNSVRSRHAALFAPWLHVPDGGRTRTVPASVVAAGLAARLDAQAPTGHLAPERGLSILDSVSDVETDFADDQHAELNGAGVNVFRRTRTSGVLLRGFRTTSNDEAWTQLSQARYIMGLSSRLAQIADRFVFRTITPATLVDYGNQIKSELKDDFDAGALFGDEPDDAYSVDTSDDVNPPEEISAGRLHALVSVQVSPFAEQVVIDLVKSAIN